MFPVRCFTCNAVVGALHPEYERRVISGQAAGPVLDEMKVARMCCRRMFLGHVDLVANQIEYGHVDVKLDDAGTLLRRRVHATREVSCD